MTLDMEVSANGAVCWIQASTSILRAVAIALHEFGRPGGHLAEDAQLFRDMLDEKLTQIEAPPVVHSYTIAEARLQRRRELAEDLLADRRE